MHCTIVWSLQVLAFPAAGTDDQHLFSMMADVLVGKDGRPFPHFSEYQGRPVNVDAPPIERQFCKEENLHV